MVIQLSYNAKSQNDNAIAQKELSFDERQRKQDMDYAFRAYKGKLPDPLKVAINQPNDNVKSNRCEPIINKGASALFGDVLKIEASDETSEEDTKVQEFIDGLWGDDDDKMTKLNKVAVNGGVFGQTFLKLIPAQGRMKYPRIVNLDPRLMRIVTAPDDCDLHLAYIFECPGPGDFQKRQIIARVDPSGSASIAGEEDIDDYWTITNYLRMGSTGSWAQSGQQDIWDYPFAPIFTCQNLPAPNEAWGTPDLTPDLIQLNEALNFLLSSLARITKYHGHPTAVATGTYASEIDTSIDGIVCLPTKDSSYTKIDAMHDFSGLLSFIEDIRSSMDEQSRIPAVALGRMKDIVKGTVSGITMKLMFQPLIEKVTLKRRLYGKLIREITLAALVVSGHLPLEQYEDYEVSLKWKNVLPVDDLNAAQTAILLKQVGISSATLIDDLGFNAENEAKLVAQEQPAQPVPVAGQEQQTAPGVGAQTGQQQEKVAA